MPLLSTFYSVLIWKMKSLLSHSLSVKEFNIWLCLQCFSMYKLLSFPLWAIWQYRKTLIVSEWKDLGPPNVHRLQYSGTPTGWWRHRSTSTSGFRLRQVQEIFLKLLFSLQRFAAAQLCWCAICPIVVFSISSWDFSRHYAETHHQATPASGKHFS